MESMVVLGLLAFGVLFVQGLLSIFQYKGIAKKYKEVRERNNMVSVGRKKNIGRGCIAMMAFTQQGICKECHILSGITIFANFRRYSAYEGCDVYDIKRKISERRSLENEAMLEAIGYVISNLQQTEQDTTGEESTKNILESA